MTGLAVAAALGAALVAGMFYAFSTFVMGALGRLPAREGIAAMQSINVVVLNPWFLGAFFGTGALSVAAVVASSGAETGARVATGVAASLYLLGCLGVTMVRNVPWNDRLAAVDATCASAHALWSRYLGRWTFWNHVRTAASFAAASVFLSVALGT